MKRLILALALIGCAWGQDSETLTNDVIIRMLNAGVSDAVIIQTINAAQSVAFKLMPANLIELTHVPVEVVNAMGLRQQRARVSAARLAESQVPLSPPLPVALPAFAPKPRLADASDVFQGRGMWDVSFDASATIPHTGGAGKSGITSGTLGYFVSRGSEIGVLGSGAFVNGGQNVILGGVYRYYFGTANPRLLPFVGSAGGVNILHVSGAEPVGHFGAIGNAGLRIFIGPRVAFEAAYTLLYSHVSGAAFPESSVSQISFGFAHVFGETGR